MSNSNLEEFEKQIVPKYRNYYVSYKQLLDAVELLKERQHTKDSASVLLKGFMLPKDFTFGDTTAMYGLLEQRPEVRFVALLQHEVSKLNHFTQLEVRTMLSSLRQLNKRLDRIVFGEDDKGVSRQVFPSIVDESESMLTLEGKVEMIRERLVSQSEEILVLEHYNRINLVAFENLTSEFDRQFADRPPITPWFVSNLIDEPFRKVPFDGLFSLIANLYKRCLGIKPVSCIETGVAKSCSISPTNLLRVKLLISSICPVNRPSSIPDSEMIVPMRPDDLSREFFKSSMLFQRVVVLDSASRISSIQFPLIDSFPRDCVLEVVVRGLGEVHCMRLDEVLDILHPQEFFEVKLIQFQLTSFDGETRCMESFQHKHLPQFSLWDYCASPLFPLSLDAGLVEAKRSSSAGSRGSQTQQPWKHLGACVLVSNREEILDLAHLYVVKELGENFSIEILDSLTESEVDELQVNHPPPVGMRHSLSTFSMPAMTSPITRQRSLPYSPKSGRPQDPMMPKLIYPKNYMANERSALAWISASAVQAGIGAALLGKPGVSFVGAVICVTALVFLWWSVYVFVRRFRQIKNRTDANDHVFYSMELATAFGITQLLLLIIQTSVMLFM